MGFIEISSNYVHNSFTLVLNHIDNEEILSHLLLLFLLISGFINHCFDSILVTIVDIEVCIYIGFVSENSSYP